VQKQRKVIKIDLTFILEKGEKISREIKDIQYTGVAYVMHGFGSGLATSTNSNVSLGTGLFSGKQIKREGSIFDAKSAYLYVTNKRLVFCGIKQTLWKANVGIGTPIAEISYKTIKGMTKGIKLSNPCIDISVPGERGGIDTVKISFLSGMFNKEKQVEKEKERNDVFDEIMKRIR